jgi:hypothetical protein
MVANSFGNRNFTQPTRRLRGAYVFLSGFVWERGWGGVGWGGVGCFPYSQCVLTMFPSSSQGVALDFQNFPQVLNVFPNIFPIAIHFLFQILWPWFKVPVYKL